MALVPFGSTSTRPNVARASASRARLRAASTVAANVSIGSRRSASRVVPAWLASPVNVEPPATVRPDRGRHADRGVHVDERAPLLDVQLDERADPAQRLVVAPEPARVGPAARMASAIDTPSASVQARARSGSSAPVSSREPTQATPNRAPSSSANATTATGRRGSAAGAAARTTSSAANAETTPSGPSYAPPSGTESRCEPITTAPRPGGPHHAHEVAVPVAVHGQPARCGGVGEPLPAGQVLGRPANRR